MNIKHILDLPFMREVVGIVGGALIALAVYTVYQESADFVTAYLLPPGTTRSHFTGEVDIADTEMEDQEGRYRQITNRAKEIAERLRINQTAMQDAEASHNAAFLENKVAFEAGAAIAEEPPAEPQTVSAPAGDTATDYVRRVQIAVQEHLEENDAQDIPSEPDVQEAAPVEEVTHPGAPSLPSSGIGLWIAAALSLGITAACTRKLHAVLFPVVSRVD